MKQKGWWKEIKIQNSKFKIQNYRLIILIALAAILFFFRLGDFSLYDAAETTYGEFIKQIRLTGDWITMHFNGQIIFDKPPLYFWLATLTTYLLGFNEFTIRFWSALCGILTVIVTYQTGRVLYDEDTGFLSGLILMTSFQFLVQSRIAELDVMLTFFLTSSLLFFYWGYQTKNRKFFLLAYPPMGLATLTKGIIGIALPTFTIFLFLLIKGELRKIREMFSIIGVLIVLIIALPWYLLEYLWHGKVFLDFVFGFLFLSRFQTVVSGHPGPWYYYFIALLLGFAPWSAFFPYSLWQILKHRALNSSLLILCYLIPPLIIFSVAKTKLPNYILPLYPFLAIMVGETWHDFLTKNNKMFCGLLFSFIFLLVVVILLMTAAVIAGQNYQGAFQEMLSQLYVLAGILGLGAIIATIFFLFKKPIFSFATLLFMVFLLVGYLLTQTLPAVENFKGTKELAQKVSQAIKENEIIAAYQIGNRPGVIFYNKKPILFIDHERELIEFLRKKKGYCFTTVEKYQALKKKFKTFATKGDLVVLY